METHPCQTQIRPWFWPLWCESEAMLSKASRPGHPGLDTSVHMRNFSSRLPRVCNRPRARDVSNRASAVLKWTHRHFYEKKSGKARSRKPSQPGWLDSFIWRDSDQSTTQYCDVNWLLLCTPAANGWRYGDIEFCLFLAYILIFVIIFLLFVLFLPLVLATSPE